MEAKLWSELRVRYRVTLGFGIFNDHDDGTNVRLWTFQGRILRLDIRKPK